MSNRYGPKYGYTGFFPIIEDGPMQSHVEELRGALTALPFGAGSLFARTGLVHGARMFILDDVIYNGHPSREEHFAYSYLTLSMTFDGELEALSAEISATDFGECDTIFSHCHGYPGVKSAEAWLAYLKACQVETTYLYVDVDDATLMETLRALRAHSLIAQMIEQAQGKPAGERKALVRALAARLAAAPEPQAGAFRDDEPFGAQTP